MRNRIINITTKAKSLAQIEREERESQSQRTPATGRASASAGASVSHSSAKPANLISSANANRPLKTLPQIEREERESTRQSSRSHAAGNASGGVGNVFSKINPDSIIRAADTARNGNKATRTERYRIQTADVPSTSTSDQRAEAALLAKLPSDFPIDRWDNMSTKEQNSIIRRSGLTVQEQWKLLNATTPMKALSVLNAVQAGLNNGTLTSRDAAALTGGSLRYAETKKQLASVDASVLPPLQKRLLRGELEDTINSIRAKAEGIDTGTLGATSNPSTTPLPKPGPSIPVNTPPPYPQNGETAYVFYTNNPGAAFAKQAEYQKKVLTEQGYQVKLVCTNNVTAFSDAWNSMDAKTGAAVIISHSNGMSLLFEEGTRANALSANGKSIDGKRTLPKISDLNGPDVALLYILACNAAHEELLATKGTNVADAFRDLSSVDTVYAYDGSVGFGVPALSEDLAPRLALDQKGYFSVYHNFDIPYKLGFPSGLQEYDSED